MEEGSADARGSTTPSLGPEDLRATELFEAGRELGELTYNLAHDLKAPLRAMRGFAEMVAEVHGSNLDEEGRHYVGLILSSASRMQLMIDGLVRYGELGKKSLNREPLDMAALAENAVTELRAAQSERVVDVRIQSVPEAFGDRAMIQDVWMHLVSNAFKFTQQTLEPRIEIGHTEISGVGAWWVKDNGVGFDMSHTKRLFEVFHRLHSPDDFPGTGVGLSMAKRILQRHGGRIWTESVPDAGATFYFTLPK